MKKTKEITGIVSMLNRFPNEQSCRDYLEQVRWPNNSIICPHCGFDKVYKFSNGKLYKCSECKKQFTVKVGTIFEDSPLPLQKWFLAIYLITAHKKGISSIQLSKDIGVTQKTAWFILGRIRQAIATKTFNKPLENIVEVDETYIGGKYSGKRGRGSENKSAVFGMAERKGRVRTMPVENVKKSTLQGIMVNSIDENATIMTDEWLAYRGLANVFHNHLVINHGKKEYVNGMIHVNNIENFWSLLKRGIIGIYHHVSEKHLHRYCQEFQYRYNSRKINDTERFNRTLGQVNGRLTYKELID
jgi:transposase-like protein